MSTSKRWLQQLATMTTNTMRLPAPRGAGGAGAGGSWYRNAYLIAPQNNRAAAAFCFSIGPKKNDDNNHHHHHRSKTTTRTTTTTTNTTEWRKHQLDKLERKFDGNDPAQNAPKMSGSAVGVVIDHEEDLQPMWQQMERRVKHRTPRTLEERGGHSGRQNIKKTDEDLWLQAGLYHHNDNNKKDDDDNNNNDTKTNHHRPEESK